VNFYIVRQGGRIRIVRHEENLFIKGGWLWRDSGNGQSNLGEILETVEGLWPGRRDNTTPANVERAKSTWEDVTKVMES
jgi:hypothetical protein